MSYEIIKEGQIERKNGNIQYASSSVVLTDYDSICIIDTAAPQNEKEIKQNLKKLDYSPNDIDFVINTHLHFDHKGCNHIFKEAEKTTDQPKDRSKFHKRINKDLNQLKIINTPGHTKNHVSVLIKDKETNKNIVVAGDALPEKTNYLKEKPPGINIDKEKSMESIQKIIKIADLVIPGHDSPFKV
ncbi:MAG: Metal-dependent hydrolase of the beta-lactamase superfamily II [Candidatus Methanohalarchaeum thermophilum]|uniref:Metallo-beta-lactamase domain-containing protein 1 n=1 Tax=Methanohalarchaeum thermophilum TaxID=1903181 RepID=A0A1Q6DS86_METT1|nr:MAG: Metal-dependent hydrolase of the beta-lactamase superfamily II [Candidatus Methanohalarchaeum thermophilum]